MKYLFLIATSVLLLSACKHSQIQRVEREEGSDLFNTTDENEEMNLAIQVAQLTLHSFDTSYANGNFDTSTFALKVRFTIEGGGEHIWASSIQIENGEYYGVIEDLPEHITEVKQGDRIKIKKEDISDWLYSDDGIMRGGYTIRAIRKNLTEAERMKFDLDFPLIIQEEVKK